MKRTATKKTENTRTGIDPSKWRSGSAGFFQFLQDVKPRVRDGRGGFIPYNPQGEVRTQIASALDGDYSTAVFCWPRRHGKTCAAVMVCLWRFITRRAENIGIVANSERQIIDTGFRILLDAFRHTPFLKSLVDGEEVRLLGDRIEAPEQSSLIQAFPASAANLWGKKLTACQVSELHASNSPDVLEALQGSLLDTADSLLVIDSTVGPKSSPLFALYSASKDADSGIYFAHIEYRDLDDAIAKQPAWIDARKLRNLAKTMLPQQFALMHLNRWGDAQSALFTREVIERCTADSYPLDAKAIAAGASFVVGGGLDRAFGMSKHGDATVTACVLKVTQDDDEHFYVLASDAVMFSRLGAIRANFTDYHRKHGMSRVGIESYNAQDVIDWSSQQAGFGEGTERINPTRQLKAAVFTSLYAAASEGRLHIHPSFTRLLAEMETFEVNFDGKLAKRGDAASEASTTIPKFQHARGCHDDHLHAVAWAIHSLRDVTLSAYEIDGIACYGSGPSVTLCALNGGQLVPFGCADQCRAMHEAKRLHDAYLSRGPRIPLPLDEFIATKVRNVGPHSLPR